MKRSYIRKISTKQRIKQQTWNKLNKSKIEETNGLCERCGKLPDWRGLSGHHIIKKSAGGKWTKSNHILLCARCHNLMHGIKER